MLAISCAGMIRAAISWLRYNLRGYITFLKARSFQEGLVIKAYKFPQ
jgi:hypothetical protein